MIDFDLSVRVRIGNSEYPSEEPSFFSKIKESIGAKFTLISELYLFLKNDREENYRYTYDEGHDAYVLLYDRNFKEGIYGNAQNTREWFYKAYSLEGNSLVAFIIPSIYVQNTVHRMEGLQMAPTDTLQSTSVAEIYLTNCDDSNIDPYIELRISYNQHGVATVWYGRASKFKSLQGYSEEVDSFKVERDSISEWLANYMEEEPDLIDLHAIRTMEEMTSAMESRNNRKRRRVNTHRD